MRTWVHAPPVWHGNILVGHAIFWRGLFRDQVNEYVRIKYDRGHQNFRNIKVGHGPKSVGNNCSQKTTLRMLYVYVVWSFIHLPLRISYFPYGSIVHEDIKLEQSLTGSFLWNLSDNKSLWVSRTLQSVQTDFNNVMIRMASILSVIFSFTILFSRLLGNVPKAPYIAEITVTFMFHSVISPQARSQYLSIFQLFFSLYGLLEWQTLLDDNFSIPVNWYDVQSSGWALVARFNFKFLDDFYHRIFEDCFFFPHISIIGIAKF